MNGPGTPRLNSYLCRHSGLCPRRQFLPAEVEVGYEPWPYNRLVAESKARFKTLRAPVKIRRGLLVTGNHVEDDGVRPLDSCPSVLHRVCRQPTRLTGRRLQDLAETIHLQICCGRKCDGCWIDGTTALMACEAYHSNVHHHI
eukprot:22639-Rhodomonas_salina.2